MKQIANSLSDLKHLKSPQVKKGMGLRDGTPPMLATGQSPVPTPGA